MFNPRNLGKFTIPAPLIQRSPDLVKQIMGSCIVLDADFQVWSQNIEYVAMSDSFEKVDEGGVIPTYVATITGDELTWENVSSPSTSEE